MIKLRSVTKTYLMGEETIFALNDVNLEIADGEFVAVVGPSGSGKSTLANIIGGLDRPDTGDVIVNGMHLSREKDNALSAYRSKTVGFVFQTFNLQPGYTALENVMLPLMIDGVSVRKRRKKAAGCLEAVGLQDRMNHKPRQLSGGQRQRVSIARALANDPRLIIADEPTGNLDSQKGSEIVDLLKSLNKGNGITLVVITHNEMVSKQADGIIEIHDGRIVADNRSIHSVAYPR